MDSIGSTQFKDKKKHFGWLDQGEWLGHEIGARCYCWSYPGFRLREGVGNADGMEFLRCT